MLQDEANCSTGDEDSSDETYDEDITSDIKGLINDEDDIDENDVHFYRQFDNQPERKAETFPISLTERLSSE